MGTILLVSLGVIALISTVIAFLIWWVYDPLDTAHMYLFAEDTAKRWGLTRHQFWDKYDVVILNGQFDVVLSGTDQKVEGL